MADVFISYSRHDEAFARRLANDLLLADVALWIDVKEIYGGKDWQDEIRKALDDCTLLIFIISPDSARSVHAQAELQHVLDAGKPVIPVLLREAEVSHEIFRLQYIDFQDQDYHLAFLHLGAALGQHGITIASASVDPNRLPDQPPLPLQIDEMFQVAKNAVWVSGIAFDKLVGNHSASIEAALLRGVTFRFLGMALDEQSLSDTAQWLGCSDFGLVFRVLNSMLRLQALARNNDRDEQVQIRSLDCRPGFGYVVVDPMADDALLTAAPYLFQLDELKRERPDLVAQPPLFYLARSSNRQVDKKWFEYFLAEFDLLWRKATDWRLGMMPEVTPPSATSTHS